ncbi:Glutathione S-transferase GST-4.5 [Roseovarius litorisediminis]|uniref:Glutathione S-transferase GST-4.5 n=1 Tax=Roseovarius litorisediminis TaxID=1312363 RepID=A0A1Y5RLR8_9RHOB|nr:glutathione S-transferase family protein [Roseovarius litorisediminis]SLN19365.1 Glutathione S-transferase GST-4.5 [Roseovarius litorisediminis]
MTYRLHYAPDNASLIVRITLEELRQPYETTLVDRAAKAQKSLGFLALNPSGLIPVLETPHAVMFETGAILLWLVDRHERLGPPPDDTQRGDFLKWLFFVANTLHPALRMVFYPDQYVGTDEATQGRLRSHMQGEITRHLDKLELVAAKSPGWFAGPDVSVLDFYVAAILRWLALYPAPKGGADWFSIDQWPHLYEMATRLEHCRCVTAAIKAEGLGQTPFTAPRYPTPPEGSAT